MDENETEFRNDGFDEEERNAMRNALEDVRNRRRRPARGPMVVYQPAPPPPGQWTAPPGWTPAPPPAQVVVTQPAAPPSLFKNVSKGQLVNVGAMALAMLAPLPAEPPATGDAGKDNANIIKYQKALAEHAKRSQQIVTIGAIAGIVL